MRVFVTGGTGLVGHRLVSRLLEKGDEVTVLTRDAEKARARLDPRVLVVEGDPCVEGRWRDALREHDAVVHLAGENIFAHRWNEHVKRQISESRVLSTTIISQALAQNPKGKVLLAASAVGYYGPRGDEELDESSTHGEDFLAHVCIDRERAASPARDAGVRVVDARIGVVLDPEGGALAQMLPPFKMFVGGPAGKGDQWISWIDAADLVELFLFALGRSDVGGPLNCTAPEPVRMREFAKAIGRALGRPSWAPVPAFALKLMLGEVAEIILTGQRVLPKKALERGFRFRHTTIDSALSALLGATAHAS